jgi:hypothetical protein
MSFDTTRHIIKNGLSFPTHTYQGLVHIHRIALGGWISHEWYTQEGGRWQQQTTQYRTERGMWVHRGDGTTSYTTPPIG